MAMAEEEFGSLFEGMVLVNPSQIIDDDRPTTPSSSSADANDDEIDTETETPSTTMTTTLLPSQKTPLDENLFSDLTLVNPPIDTTTHELDRSNSMEVSSSSRHQISSRRKKKSAALRIGYARETTTITTTTTTTTTTAPSPPQPSSPSSSHRATIDLQHSYSYRELDSSSVAGPIAPLEPPMALACRTDQDDSIDPSSSPVITTVKSDEVTTVEEEYEASDVSVEEKLELIRAGISDKLQQIRAVADSVSASRKESARKRRLAAENVNHASINYEELEKELEEACETEDFERAERVSESLVVADKEKQELLNALRDAELDCDAVDLKMQEVLELQIAAEEEGVSLLKQLAKDAADNADSVLRDAEIFSSKEMAEWESSTEFLEMKKMELDLESILINDARSGFNDSIEHLIENDSKEKELLNQKRKLLMEELDNLLALVRLKEEEISENNSHIQEVERRIAGVVSGFNEAESRIDLQYSDVQSTLEKIAADIEVLSVKKKEIDDYLALAEEKRSRLTLLVNVAADEAKACQELVGLRKNLASSVLKSREDKVRLAKTEEKISEEVQILRQEVSAARVSLQELSSTRATIQQEIASSKQRIIFIDKRGPELEAEKKVAAAARNFKEAGRIAAEAKALSIEKEDRSRKMEKATSELEKLEEDIRNTVDKLQETEELILSKEREIAMAGCKRLRIVAAAAMAERSAALELGDLEEANIFLAEAEAANSEATKLQKAYNFEAEEFAKISKHFLSLAVITNLAGKQLVEIAAASQQEDK